MASYLVRWPGQNRGRASAHGSVRGDRTVLVRVAVRGPGDLRCHGIGDPRGSSGARRRRRNQRHLRIRRSDTDRDPQADRKLQALGCLQVILVASERDASCGALGPSGTASMCRPARSQGPCAEPGRAAQLPTRRTSSARRRNVPASFAGRNSNLPVRPGSISSTCKTFEPWWTSKCSWRRRW